MNISFRVLWDFRLKKEHFKNRCFFCDLSFFHRKRSGAFGFQQIGRIWDSFWKLVSVSTDGSSNMIGENMGMIARLKRLVQQCCFTKQTPFHVFSFYMVFDLPAKPSNEGLYGIERGKRRQSFSDWFSDWRKQVLYESFLTEKIFNGCSKRSLNRLTHSGCFT